VPEIAENKDPYYREVAQQLLARGLAWQYFTDENANPEWPQFTLFLCDGVVTTPRSNCIRTRTMAFTPDYYKGDRSMRESGFDISFRFGPFSGETHHYAPVCLNSLLYKTEKDLEEISGLLGRTADQRQWRQRAEARAQAMQKYLWDAQPGMFFDYDFQNNRRSSYVYATTFYPLWAGLATAEQARAVARNLAQFEQPGGMVMSTTLTGVQWDYPYGWAPIQLLAVEGLRRYGFNSEADRISQKFLTMVAENLRRDGTIREKYNVVTRSSETHVTAGYKANVVGFGWTNGVFLELLHGLRQDPIEYQAPRTKRGGSQSRPMTKLHGLLSSREAGSGFLHFRSPDDRITRSPDRATPPFGKWQRLSENPVLHPQGNGWESSGVFNPAVAKEGGQFVMLYRAQDRNGTSRLGYATSTDGVHFSRRPQPVLTPQADYERDGGVEDPRLVKIDPTYYLTYTGYNKHDAQLCLATSRDLVHWERKGILLPAYKGKWNVGWTKSGAMVTEKIGGKYWMYYLGTMPDKTDQMGIASSSDLAHWTDATSSPVLPRRPGRFDSRVVEPGPPPLITDEGIFLIYNGADDHLVYSVGWALFDKSDPTKVLARSSAPIFRPEREWEKVGQVPQVVFVEGLVRDGNRWLFYYGGADKYVGVAAAVSTGKTAQ